MTPALIDRYVGGYVIGGTLAALGLLVILFGVIDLVDDLDNVGTGTYTALGAALYQALLVPGRVVSMLPVAALIGSVFGLGILASSNELIAFRAAGVSIARIAVAVLKSALLMVVVALTIGELVVPGAEQRAETERSAALERDLAINAQHGFWIRDGLAFIKVRRILPSSELQGVDIHEFSPEHKLLRAWHATTARFTSTGWILEDVRRSQLTDSGVIVTHFEEQDWNIVLSPDQLRAVALKPERLSASGLVRYLRFLRGNGLNSARYELALWNKITYPLVTGSLVFLAVVLVLGLLSAVSVGYRLLIGTLVGVSFHIMQKMSMHTGLVFEVSPVISVLAPALACTALGLILLRRVN
ncbi:MAG: LPS export ABC transporter permease LptG [Gammaproteobacteria bacterium]|nr:LPS export ABC transporter permease LptG [Gammaproteobacteria bacterium]